LQAANGAGFGTVSYFMEGELPEIILRGPRSM
jgi:hypothetical protein